MKNKFLTHKLLPVLSIFLLALFVLCTSCFASNTVSFTNSYTNKQIDMIFPNLDYNYYLIFTIRSNNKYTYYLTLSNQPMTLTSSPNFKVSTVDGSNLYYYEYGSVDSSCTTIDFSNKSPLMTTRSVTLGSTVELADYYIATANYDVYNDSNELVFQGAPQEIAQVEPMKIQQVEELVPKMVEIVKIVLPVCLIVFGTLLVVYLIKSKNLLHL